MLISLMNGSDKDQRLDGYRVGESVAGAAPTQLLAVSDAL